MNTTSKETGEIKYDDYQIEKLRTVLDNNEYDLAEHILAIDRVFYAYIQVCLFQNESIVLQDVDVLNIQEAKEILLRLQKTFDIK